MCKCAITASPPPTQSTANRAVARSESPTNELPPDAISINLRPDQIEGGSIQSDSVSSQSSMTPLLSRGPPDPSVQEEHGRDGPSLVEMVEVTTTISQESVPQEVSVPMSQVEVNLGPTIDT